jgi:hypothetical protein
LQDNNCTVEEQNDEATSASLLHSASLDDQNSYIKAWASVLAVCASELQHALDVWNQAQKEGVQQDLLANLEGSLVAYKCDSYIVCSSIPVPYILADSVCCSQLKDTSLQLGKYMWFL